MSHIWLAQVNNDLGPIRPSPIEPQLPLSDETEAPLTVAQNTVDAKPTAPYQESFALNKPTFGIERELQSRGIGMLNKIVTEAWSAMSSMGSREAAAAKVLEVVSQARSFGRLYNVRINTAEHKGELIFLTLWAMMNGSQRIRALAFNEMAEILSVFDQDHRLHEQLSHFMNALYVQPHMTREQIISRLNHLRGQDKFNMFLQGSLSKTVTQYLQTYLNKNTRMASGLLMKGVIPKNIFENSLNDALAKWPENTEAGKHLRKALEETFKEIKANPKTPLPQMIKKMQVGLSQYKISTYLGLGENLFPFKTQGQHFQVGNEFLYALENNISNQFKTLSPAAFLNSNFYDVIFGGEAGVGNVQYGLVRDLDEAISGIPSDNEELENIRKDFYALRLIQIASWDRSESKRAQALKKVNQFIDHHEHSSAYIKGKAYALKAQLCLWLASDFEQWPRPQQHNDLLGAAVSALNTSNQYIKKISMYNRSQNELTQAGDVRFHANMMELFLSNHLVLADYNKMYGLRERFPKTVKAYRGYIANITDGGTNLLGKMSNALRKIPERYSKINDRLILSLLLYRQSEGKFAEVVKGVNEAEIEMNDHRLTKVSKNNESLKALMHKLNENHLLKSGIRYAREHRWAGNYIEDFFKPLELSLYARTMIDLAWNQTELKNYGPLIEIISSARVGKKIEDLPKQVNKKENLSRSGLQKMIGELPAYQNKTVESPFLKNYFSGSENNWNWHPALAHSLQYAMTIHRPLAPEIAEAKAHFWNREIAKSTALLEGSWLNLEAGLVTPGEERGAGVMNPRDFTHLLLYLILNYQSQGKYGYTKAHQILQGLLEGEDKELLSDYFKLSGAQVEGLTIKKAKKLIGPVFMEWLKVLKIKNDISGDPRYLYVDEKGEIDPALETQLKKEFGLKEVTTTQLTRYQLNQIWLKNLTQAQKTIEDFELEKLSPIVAEDKELKLLLEMQQRALPAMVDLQKAQILEKQEEKAVYAQKAQSKLEKLMKDDDYYQLDDFYLYSSDLAAAVSQFKTTLFLKHDREAFLDFQNKKGEPVQISERREDKELSSELNRVSREKELVSPHFEDEFSMARLEGIFSHYPERDVTVQNAINEAQKLFSKSRFFDVRLRALLLQVDAHLYRNQPVSAEKILNQLTEENENIKLELQKELLNELRQKYPPFYLERLKIRILQKKLEFTANVYEIQEIQNKTQKQYQKILDNPEFLPFEKDQIKIEYANYLALIAIKSPKLLKTEPIAKAFELLSSIKDTKRLSQMEPKAKLHLQLAWQSLCIANLQGRNRVSLGHQAEDIFIDQKKMDSLFGKWHEDLKTTPEMKSYSLVLEQISNLFQKAQAHQVFRALPEKFENLPERLKTEANHLEQADQLYREIVKKFDELFKDHTQKLTVDEIEVLQAQLAEIKLSHLELALKRVKNMKETFANLDIVQKKSDYASLQKDYLKMKAKTLEEVQSQVKEILFSPDTRLTHMLKARTRLLLHQIPQAENDFKETNRQLDYLENAYFSREMAEKINLPLEALFMKAEKTDTILYYKENAEEIIKNLSVSEEIKSALVGDLKKQKIQQLLLRELYAPVARQFQQANNLYYLSVLSTEPHQQNEFREQALLKMEQTKNEIEILKSERDDFESENPGKVFPKNTILAQAYQVEIALYSHHLARDYDEAVKVFETLEKPQNKMVKELIIANLEKHEYALWKANIFKWGHRFGESQKIYDDLLKTATKHSSMKEALSADQADYYANLYELKLAQADLELMKTYYTQSGKEKIEKSKEVIALTESIIKEASDQTGRRWEEIYFSAMFLQSRARNANLVHGQLAELEIGLLRHHYQTYYQGEPSRKITYFTLMNELQTQFELAESKKSTVILNPQDQAQRHYEAISFYQYQLPRLIEELRDATEDARDIAQIAVYKELAKISLIEVKLQARRPDLAEEALLLITGEVSSRQILEIFGSENDEWKQFFVDPSAKSLIFKPISASEITSKMSDSKKRQKLLNLWQLSQDAILVSPEKYQDSTVARAKLSKVSALQQLYRYPEAISAAQDNLTEIATPGRVARKDLPKGVEAFFEETTDKNYVRFKPDVTMTQLKDQNSELVKIFRQAKQHQQVVKRFIEMQPYTKFESRICDLYLSWIEDEFPNAKYGEGYSLVSKQDLREKIAAFDQVLARTEAQIQSALSKKLAPIEQEVQEELKVELTLLKMKRKIYEAALAGEPRHLNQNHAAYQEAHTILKTKITETQKKLSQPKDLRGEQYALGSFLQALNFVEEHELVLKTTKHHQAFAKQLESRDVFSLQLQVNEAKDRMAAWKTAERLERARQSEQSYVTQSEEKEKFLEPERAVKKAIVNLKKQLQEVKKLYEVLKNKSIFNLTVKEKTRLREDIAALRLRQIEIKILLANETTDPSERNSYAGEAVSDLKDIIEESLTTVKDENGKTKEISTLAIDQQARIDMDLVYAYSLQNRFLTNPQGSAVSKFEKIIEEGDRDARYGIEISKLLRKKFYANLKAELNIFDGQQYSGLKEYELVLKTWQPLRDQYLNNPDSMSRDQLKTYFENLYTLTGLTVFLGDVKQAKKYFEIIKESEQKTNLLAQNDLSVLALRRESTYQLYEKIHAKWQFSAGYGLMRRDVQHQTTYPAIGTTGTFTDQRSQTFVNFVDLEATHFLTDVFSLRAALHYEFENGQQNVQNQLAGNTQTANRKYQSDVLGQYFAQLGAKYKTQPIPEKTGVLLFRAFEAELGLLTSSEMQSSYLNQQFNQMPVRRFGGYLNLGVAFDTGNLRWDIKNNLATDFGQIPIANDVWQMRIRENIEMGLKLPGYFRNFRLSGGVDIDQNLLPVPYAKLDWYKQLPWGLFGLNKGKENSAYFRTGIKAPIPLAGDRRYTSFLDNLSFQAALGLERGLNRYEIEGFKRYQPNLSELGQSGGQTSTVSTGPEFGARFTASFAIGPNSPEKSESKPNNENQYDLIEKREFNPQDLKAVLDHSAHELIRTENGKVVFLETAKSEQEVLNLLKQWKLVNPDLFFSVWKNARKKAI